MSKLTFSLHTPLMAGKAIQSRSDVSHFLNVLFTLIDIATKFFPGYDVLNASQLKLALSS